MGSKELSHLNIMPSEYGRYAHNWLSLSIDWILIFARKLAI